MKAFDPWKLLAFWREISLFAMAAGSGFWAWMRSRQAQSWPSVQGMVTEAVARNTQDRQIMPWVGELAYAYVVNGQYYSGFYTIRARNERRAEELVAGWKGRTVVVRHSPDRHDVSVLLKSDQPGGQLGNQV